jgi:hypothetical protein
MGFTLKVGLAPGESLPGYIAAGLHCASAVDGIADPQFRSFMTARGQDSSYPLVVSHDFS